MRGEGELARFTLGVGVRATGETVFLLFMIQWSGMWRLGKALVLWRMRKWDWIFLRRRSGNGGNGGFLLVGRLLTPRAFRGENPLSVDLNWSYFFVHIHDLPLRMMNKDVAEVIGNRIGKFVDFDKETTWGASVRIRVLLDIRVPLKRFLRVRAADGEITLSFTYERLPNFCYGYGILGHIMRDCSIVVDDRVLDGGTKLQYGAWLQES
ncbi:UNVERIFIED_CONTAM: hypothetical protein Sradi_6154200 [Sesamum radiatum]|uniref:Zinc knuckle CX2CX4HX4C domain-containing protein n=1 Tax=Sesamum radiatum TaxID=300843 RepID=A0AAW2K9V4_SESRA